MFYQSQIGDLKWDLFRSLCSDNRETGEDRGSDFNQIGEVFNFH